MVDEEREYERFTKYLAKGYFTLNEVRKLIENDFVANVSPEEPDPNHKSFIKYSIKLVDGDIYYVYAQP